MMRVARLYGERPVIYRATGWRTLEQLASSVTSEAERLEFEARILAGTRINGVEIIRSRNAKRAASQGRSAPGT
jgi:hypothetical protein